MTVCNNFYPESYLLRTAHMLGHSPNWVPESSLLFWIRTPIPPKLRWPHRGLYGFGATGSTITGGTYGGGLLLLGPPLPPTPIWPARSGGGRGLTGPGTGGFGGSTGPTGGRGGGIVTGTAGTGGGSCAGIGTGAGTGPAGAFSKSGWRQQISRSPGHLDLEGSRVTAESPLRMSKRPTWEIEKKGLKGRINLGRKNFDLKTWKFFSRP